VVWYFCGWEGKRGGLGGGGFIVGVRSVSVGVIVGSGVEGVSVYVGVIMGVVSGAGSTQKVRVTLTLHQMSQHILTCQYQGPNASSGRYSSVV